ncbi:hypothetical protein MRB53_027085 [Persea americana]|uniref:Uncharacterized protein n=1 Tax=Persea americana TaxID=3435 RepID=A0ACC2LL23_PERAE|nr:hypothetical protein MRB53_027085 [Persea americana]
MLKARHTIIDNQRWVIGNGQEVSALDDHWVPNMGILRSQLIADIDTVQAATSTLNMLRLADLLHQSPTGLCWNEGLLCRLWQPHIVQAILLIPLGTRDLRCWKDEPAGTPRNKDTQNLIPEGERFLWYAPHTRFSDQLSELKNAIVIASILNRTLIIPPVLDHHSVALGSCPKLRVSSLTELRVSVWDHMIQLVQTRRYVSMADIVDISSVISSSSVRTVDFRVFASLWCGLNMDLACFGSLCCAISELGSMSGDFKQCRSLLSGPTSNIGQCTYAVEEDCRTTVWTYQQNNERRAETATVLEFGSLFTAPYKGSELYIDIHEAPRDPQRQSLLQKIEFLPFVPEIMDAGKEFSVNRIKVPFLCAQLRLLDGQFKNHWKDTFLALKQKMQSLQEVNNRKENDPIDIFIMTDLPSSNWSETYLGELARDSNAYKLHYLQEGDELVVQTAQKVMVAEHGLRSGFLPRILDGKSKKSCRSVVLPDILLYIEEAICNCPSLVCWDCWVNHCPKYRAHEKK